MLLSIIYAVVRRLLDTLTVAARRETTKNVESLVLRHENAVLRRQVGSNRRTQADRLRSAALSRPPPPMLDTHLPSPPGDAAGMASQTRDPQMRRHHTT